MNQWKTIKSNLWRNVPSGKYYAVVKVKGRRIWRSLKTTQRSVADLKLAKKLAEVRAGEGAVHAAALTLGEATEIYLQRKNERGYRRRNRQGEQQSHFKPLKPRSMDYRRETIEAWRRLWDGFDGELIALITQARCHAMADAARRKYGATRFNGMVQSLRGIFEIAKESGACEKNPAMEIGFSEVKPAEKAIPTREQVTEILRLLDAHPRRKHARLSVRLAMFTGIRPNEARHLAAHDINLAAGTLTARETKNGKPRTIQLIPQAVELFRDEKLADILAAARKDPRRAVRTIGKLVGVDTMTPYTMRHLHMSALVESGVDIATAALIAGQQDRGVTLMRHYVHPRSEHVRKQLNKVII